MITCPACGKENEDSAHECRRCRAFLRDDHEAHQAHAASQSLGEVCRRCETFNEPGVSVCTNCGLTLVAGTPPAAAPVEEPPLDKTPPQAFSIGEEQLPPETTPVDGSASLSDELSALAISDQEAAEAGLSTHGNGAAEETSFDKTPPEPFVLPQAEPEPPPQQRARAAESISPGGGVTSSRRVVPVAEAPRQAPVARPAAEPAVAPAEKLCSSCGSANPPAAKFCFDCGTPFVKKPAAAPAPIAAPEPLAAAPAIVATPPPSKLEPVRPMARPAPEPPPSIHVDAELIIESTSETAPVKLDEAEAALEEAPLELLPSEEVPIDEAHEAHEDQLKVTSEGDPLPMSLVMPEERTAEDPFEPEGMLVEEPPAEQQLHEEAAVELPADAAEPIVEAHEEPLEEPPFPANVVAEKSGISIALSHLETTIGAAGAHVELDGDPFIAPRAATLAYAEDHLVLRDEGSANGVYVKVREHTPLAAGDSFIAGERLFRFDGPTELARGGEGETPFLGAPRPAAGCVRISEVLAGGKTGRTCHRAGPVIAIGRSGCDMNFPSDSLLAARHAEIRIAEDGSATLVDLGQGPSGVLLRVRAEHWVRGGDVVQLGEQQLRVEITTLS